MADDLLTAFSPLAERAAAQAERPDRISVRDYVRAVEIGAFESERGQTQRLRFDIVLEVAASAEGDDVDSVLSYDTLVGAVEAELAERRLNLLETLAEGIAARSLADRRARRVFVRVEKLDRIPGALGVEIVRRREDVVAQAPGGSTPRVVRLEAGADHRALTGPMVVVLPPAQVPDASGEAGRRLTLLAMEQAAWELAGRDPRFTVAASRTEIDWALGQGFVCLWAPSKLVLAAAVPPEAEPVALADWLARELGAGEVETLGRDGGMRAEAASGGDI